MKSNEEIQGIIREWRKRVLMEHPEFKDTLREEERCKSSIVYKHSSRKPYRKGIYRWSLTAKTAMEKKEKRQPSV
jgi:hypothetical protein